MQRAAVPVSIVALALAVFAAWMHPAVLLPGNVGWLLDGNDRGQSAIGMAAWLTAGGPFFHQTLLAAPEGMTLLFTDSIPLIGVVLKPFAALLPAGLQFIGPWYLLCLLLHAGFAFALVRRHAPDAPTAWLGAALLTLMPALLNRYGHASLCAQWLLLWAFWVFVEPARARAWAWWAAVLGVAALVHSYLLLMVAAIWASAMLREVTEGRGRRALPGIVAVPALVAGIALLHGALGGGFVSTHSYGRYPLALDAWWNPAHPGYSALLPSSADPDAVGYEGLQYLGAGLLVLVVLGAVRLPRDPAARRMLAPLAWLLPALVVLTVVAVGPQPLWRGMPLGALRLPPALVDLLDPVRASGRLGWPATYALAYAAIALACRCARATLILTAALALQVADLAPMLGAIRATSARADDPTVFTRTRDPRWAGLVARAAAVEYQPADPFLDLQLLEEVTWRAVAACQPVRFFYAARQSQAVRTRLAADAAAFAAGRTDPTRLYVLLDGRAPPALAARVRRLDGIAIIPPSAPATPPPAACVSASPRSAS